MKQPPPPSETTRVHAERVLVLAPHQDDEVLGCGGLLAALAAAGSQVRVLFLTDGAAGDPEARDPAATAARRREEAQAACRALGAGEPIEAGLPDGRLEHHLEEAAAAVARALEEVKPDLLLAPSPLEVSADHRAAFAALHRLLAPLRGEGALAAAARGTRTLLYEVNATLHPDLLVDVGRELPALEKAMACYRSQEEAHPYLRAALGLARFRTLSLPPEVEAAEAYRELALADFVTRSPAQLIRHLGGVPEVAEVREGPRFSVVVRTRDRPGLLAEALASLAAGAYRRAEVVLVNDGGPPPQLPSGFPLPVVRRDLPENRGRAAAAQAGVEAAGGDFVVFLDDDDLAAPEHLATLAGLVSGAGVRVAYTDAAVGIYEPDAAEGWRCAERRLPYSRDFDPRVLLLDNYIPFNTLAIDRRLFAEVGPFDPSFPFFEDWDFLIRLAALTPFHHLPRVTCEYRHFRSGGHHVFGEAPSKRADFLEVKARVLAKHAGRLTPELLAAAADTLRAEAVEGREEAAATRREAAAARRERQEAEARFHRANGELHSFKGEREALLASTEAASAELRRLYGEEETLRRGLAEQTETVAATYAEIERLNGLVREMESTRAWRLHEWLQRRLRR